MNNTYPCKDLMLAACILARGISLIDYKRESDHLVFIFDDKNECEKIDREWWSGSAMVEAPKYAEAIKRLKNLVYSKF